MWLKFARFTQLWHAVLLSFYTDLDESCDWEIIEEEEWEQEEDCRYKAEWLPIHEDLLQAQPISLKTCFPQYGRGYYCIRGKLKITLSRLQLAGCKCDLHVPKHMHVILIIFDLILKGRQSRYSQVQVQQTWSAVQYNNRVASSTVPCSNACRSSETLTTRARLALNFSSLSISQLTSYRKACQNKVEKPPCKLIGQSCRAKLPRRPQYIIIRKIATLRHSCYKPF